MPIKLQKRGANGGTVSSSTQDEYTLALPPLPGRKYGLAQVDDYLHLARSQFPHQPPLRLTLEARVSAPHLPGTWGFGYWNDPFSFGFGGGGMARALPVVPNAAWFFYGSPDNHLTLRDDLPGAGFQAKTFQAPQLSSLLSILAIPALPFMVWPAVARIFRKLARRIVKEDATYISASVEDWHTYTLHWMHNRVIFTVDTFIVLETEVAPHGPLGLVIWIDNQYFRFVPDGKIGFGFLEVPQGGSLHVRNLMIEKL
jgi:hypothetical protein